MKLPADHAAGDADRLAGHGADLRAGARRAVRPGRASRTRRRSASSAATEHGDLAELRGSTGAYVRLLRRAASAGRRWSAGAASSLVAGSWWAYGTFGRGVEFFPEVEPEQAQVQVHARGDLSVRRARPAGARGRGAASWTSPGIDTSTRAAACALRGGEDIDEDVVGMILLEFTDWRTRPAGQRDPGRDPPAHRRPRRHPGRDPRGRGRAAGRQAGPARRSARADPGTARRRWSSEVRGFFDRLPGLKDVTDSRPVPGIEWRSRSIASRPAASAPTSPRSAPTVQLVTNGILVGDYRPDDADDEVDIRRPLSAGRRAPRAVRPAARQHRRRRRADRQLRRAHGRSRASAT